MDHEDSEKLKGLGNAMYLLGRRLLDASVDVLTMSSELQIIAREKQDRES